MWIERAIGDTLQMAFRQFKVVTLTGARQVGKTSLARHLFPQVNYISLEQGIEAERARLDFPAFLAKYPPPLIIDEVQYVPEIFGSIKAEVDRADKRGQFVLTGSQNFAMMAGVTESLAGRSAVLSLPTLSFKEVESALHGTRIEEFLFRGGYPELWRRPELNRELWYGSYVTTYLERDVRNLVQVGNLRDFERFLRALAARIGQLLSLSELARDVAISTNTAKSWLSILEASHQIFLLSPYHRSVSKRIVKTPKLYFWDTGLLAYLLGFQDPQAVMEHTAWGSIWENLVVSEVHKHFLNRGSRRACWFWRTVQGDEVDLLVETGPQRFLAIESKTASTVSSKALRGINALEKEYGSDAVIGGALVCRTDSAYPLSAGGRFSAIPLGGTGGLHAWLESALGD